MDKYKQKERSRIWYEKHKLRMLSDNEYAQECLLKARERAKETFKKIKLEGGENFARYREQNRIRVKQWHEKNKEYSKNSNREYYTKNKKALNKNRQQWYCDNIEYSRNKTKENRLRMKEKFPEKLRAIELERVVRRNSMKMQRTPSWADYKKIKAIYVEAARISKETGIKYHVDHIAPLRGRNISGLHVHNNLQIITEKENLSKSNKYSINL